MGFKQKDWLAHPTCKPSISETTGENIRGWTLLALARKAARALAHNMCRLMTRFPKTSKLKSNRSFIFGIQIKIQ